MLWETTIYHTFWYEYKWILTKNKIENKRLIKIYQDIFLLSVSLLFLLYENPPPILVNTLSSTSTLDLSWLSDFNFKFVDTRGEGLIWSSIFEPAMFSFSRFKQCLQNFISSCPDLEQFFRHWDTTSDMLGICGRDYQMSENYRKISSGIHYHFEKWREKKQSIFLKFYDLSQVQFFRIVNTTRK